MSRVYSVLIISTEREPTNVPAIGKGRGMLRRQRWGQGPTTLHNHSTHSRRGPTKNLLRTKRKHKTVHHPHHLPSQQSLKHKNPTTVPIRLTQTKNHRRQERSALPRTSKGQRRASHTLPIKEKPRIKSRRRKGLIKNGQGRKRIRAH